MDYFYIWRALRWFIPPFIIRLNFDCPSSFQKSQCPLWKSTRSVLIADIVHIEKTLRGLGSICLQSPISQFELKKEFSSGVASVWAFLGKPKQVSRYRNEFNWRSSWIVKDVNKLGTKLQSENEHGKNAFSKKHPSSYDANWNNLIIIETAKYIHQICKPWIWSKRNKYR